MVEDRDGDIAGERVSRFGLLAIETEEDVRVIAAPPSLGTGDVRPDAVLGDAVDRGLAQRREVREVGGRRCRVHRFGSSVSDGTLVPVGTRRGEHADVCIDGDGLVLEEWWVRDGAPVRHRLVTEVVTDVDDDFRLVGEGERDGEVAPSDVAPVVTIEPPSGFRAVGRFDVVTAPLGELPSRALVASVWTRGPDLLVLEHAAGDVAPHPHAIAVDLGDELGAAELVPDLRSSEVRLDAGDRAVRVYGTIPPDDLLEVAKTISFVNP